MENREKDNTENPSTFDSSRISSQEQNQDTNSSGSEQPEQNQKEDTPAEHIWEKMKGNNMFNDAQTVNFYIDYRNEINNGIHIGDHATMNDINFHTFAAKDDAAHNTAFSLAKDSKKMADWISKNYFKPSLAFLITIAAFNEMPYNWIIEEKENLYLCLIKNEAGKPSYEVEAIEKTLWEIGAETCDGEISDYAGKREEKFIKYRDNEDANRIIEYVWTQFPNLKAPILEWFIKHIEAGRSIYAKRITAVLSLLASKDYGYFVNHIIPRLYQAENVSVDITLSQILNELMKRQRESVISMLTHWSTQNRVHPLLTVLLVAREMNDGEKILRQAINTYLHVIHSGNHKKENQFLSHLIDFFAVGVRKVVFYRLLIEELHGLFFKGTNSKISYENLDLFLSLIWIDVFLSCGNDKKQEEAILIKMCIVENSAKNKLCQIWNKVWKTHSYRSEFYQVLGQYYKQLQDEALRKHLLAFLDMILGKEVSTEKKLDIYGKIKRQGSR